MMIRILAIAAAATFVTANDFAHAQSKKNDAISASRFGISVDGVQNQKKKGLKSTSEKKGSSVQTQK